MRDFLETGGALGIIALVFAPFAAWATHIVWVIKTLMSDVAATGGQIALGIIGAFMPPVGVIHGFMVWFGIGA